MIEEKTTTPKLIFTWLSTTGESMDPLIKSSSRLEIELTQNRSYSYGDIVVFIYNRKLVAHRIIKIIKQKNALKYMLKGDNNNTIDGIFKNNRLIGKVTKIIHSDYEIDLNSRKNNILKHFFVWYSILTAKLPALRILRKLYRLKPCRNLYQSVIKI